MDMATHLLGFWPLSKKTFFVFTASMLSDFDPVLFIGTVC